jgi:hypothetical protein
MLQLLMAAQKGQLNKTDDEDVGTIGEDAADSELHKKHMTSKKGDALSNANVFKSHLAPLMAHMNCHYRN